MLVVPSSDFLQSPSLALCNISPNILINYIEILMYAKIREFSFMLPGLIFIICTLLYSLPQVSSAHHRLLNCNLSVLGRVRNKTEKCTTGAQGLLQRLRAFNYKNPIGNLKSKVAYGLLRTWLEGVESLYDTGWENWRN